MEGQAFTYLAAALVGLTDSDLELVAMAASGVIASRHGVTICAVLVTITEQVDACPPDTTALVACGMAHRDQLAAAEHE